MRRFPLLPLLAALLLVLATAPARAADDPGFPQQWHLKTIGAETAWPTGTGLGITIAVVDTGADYGHVDLKGNLVPGHNLVKSGASAQDDNGHGTHVAGIAGAMTNNGTGVAGTAPDAHLLPVKVLGGDGTGTEQNVGDGIRWAVDNGAAVVNVSIGVEFSTNFSKRPVKTPLPSSPIISAVRYAWNHGVICVMAAGNDDRSLSVYSNESALVVGATDRFDQLASYSNKVGAAKWGLVAPGGSGATDDAHASDNVLSTYWVSDKPNVYAWAAGTSMAAPQVAGAAAILRGLGLTAQQAVDRLLNTAKDLGTAGDDTTYGYGRLDLARAVAGLTPTTTHSATAKATTTTTTTTARRRTTGTTTTTRGGAPSTSQATTTTTPASGGAPLVTVDAFPPDDDNGDDGIQRAAGARPDGGGDKDLPLAPALAAAGLLVVTALRLLRARRR